MLADCYVCHKGMVCGAISLAIRTNDETNYYRVLVLFVVPSYFCFLFRQEFADWPRIKQNEQKQNNRTENSIVFARSACVNLVLVNLFTVLAIHEKQNFVFAEPVSTILCPGIHMRT